MQLLAASTCLAVQEPLLTTVIPRIFTCCGSLQQRDGDCPYFDDRLWILAMGGSIGRLEYK